TRNKVYGLSNAGTSVTTTAPSAIVGIGVRSGTTALAIQNNMISLGDGITTNSAIIGIMLNHGSTPDPIDNVYFNSIYINGTATSGAQPSIGIYRGDFSVTARVVTVNIKNNIVSNQRGGGTGKHYAIANNLGATTSATGWAANASNNNVFNVANPATLGYWTTDQNFATWQTASLCDGLSKTGLSLPFVNTPTADLHLNFGLTPTQIESGGVAIAGISNDFDNDARPGPTGSLNGGGTLPDLGADEIDAVPLDVTAPSISNITLLGNACGTSGRTVTAVIGDLSGVDNGGSEPQIYFRKNGGAYFSEPGTLTAGTVYNGTWTFNINYVPLGGVVYTDLIEYFIVAQDALTNVGGTPALGLTLTDVFTVTTPPTTPLSYTIQTFISGNYPVGVGQSGLGGYETLTAAIAAFNSSCLGGPVTYTLMDATYPTETFPITINNNPDASATNTLTIKPNTGVNAAITGSLAGFLIRTFNSYVTIDGSNNGSNSRNLTISNTSATSPSVILIGSTGTTPIHHVAVKNSILLNGATTNTAVVISDGSVPATAGYFNNITIDNNDIQKAFIGCYSIAALVAGNGGNTAFTNNTLTATGANAIRRVGLYLQGLDGATVSGNSIGNFDASAAESDYGIWLATGTYNTTISNNTISNLGMASTGAFAPYGIYVSSGVSQANIVVNANTISGLSSAGGGAGVATNGIFFGFATSHGTISNNQITNIKNTSASGWGANGIQLTSSSLSANILVSNNFISDVAGYGFAGGSMDDNGYGISVNSGAGYSIYHNTVNLTSSQTATTGYPAALLVGAGVTTPGAIDLRNNIFVNSQTAGTERYAIYSAAASTVFSNINYNNYFSAGPNLGFIGSNRVDLTAIASGFGGNANSVSVNPVFTSPTDLHLVSSSNAGLSDLGTPITAVPTDIDAQTRSTSTPDMGADEFIGQTVLNLKLWLQGYYSGGAMAPVMENQASVIPHDPTLDVDDITVELRSAATPSTVSYTTTARLKTNGGAVATFSTGVSGNYHIVINHRNTLQTWSNDPIAFPPTGTIDFTTAATAALGSNMKEVPTTGSGVWALYTGDLNQDGFIDSFDFPAFDTDSFNGVSGVYVPTDLNGDGFVDSFDFPILDENSFNGVTAVTL
ncbi:MAG TPA: right-handed parallel beta-helix repeat-containing protein, partial [Chitinophagaceae bacterium]|nr:right-handed parallel beta-helix repeat-containing protein [Chitinophagaceae bacterium]